MTLTFSFSSLPDVFAKLKRDAAALEAVVTGDGLHNFVITGYSMIDWVKKDPTVPASAKAAHVVQALYSDRWLKVCGDLATSCKHFSLTLRNPITDCTTTESGFGMGRYGAGGYGVGEEYIEIRLDDGATFTCLDLVNGVLSTWEVFFTVHGI